MVFVLSVIPFILLATLVTIEDFESVRAGSQHSFCTGYIGDEQYFRHDMGADNAYVRFAGRDITLEVPYQFRERLRTVEQNDGSTEEVFASESPYFHNTQWVGDDIVVQFSEIEEPVMHVGDESDGLTVYYVSMNGAGFDKFDRKELKIECGL